MLLMNISKRRRSLLNIRMILIRFVCLVDYLAIHLFPSPYIIPLTVSFYSQFVIFSIPYSAHLVVNNRSVVII